jgi:carbamoyltransferase
MSPRLYLLAARAELVMELAILPSNSTTHVYNGRRRRRNLFELDSDSPYVLVVADVVEHRRKPMTAEQQKLFGIEKLNVPRSDIPAVTHVDYWGRIQTVHRESNPRYHALITRFKELTACPVIVNTSFTVRGSRSCALPKNAHRCFMGTKIEALAIGNCFLRREEQPAWIELRYENAFTPTSWAPALTVLSGTAS